MFIYLFILFLVLALPGEPSSSPCRGAKGSKQGGKPGRAGAFPLSADLK